MSFLKNKSSGYIQLAKKSENKNAKTLYKKDAKGVIRVWSIEIDYILECLTISHGSLGGEIQDKDEYIEEGKAGRSIEEQLESRLSSRVNKKLDAGYTENISDAKNGAVNSLGLIMPMKAQPTVDKYLKWKKNIGNVDWRTAYIQRKYNGLRCLSTRDFDGIVTYTRGSKRLEAISHIRKDIENLEECITIDGELYHHGTPLQTINSWVKRQQEDTKKLTYVVYDLACNAPFIERFEMLLEICKSLGDSVIVAETFKVDSFEAAIEYFQQFRDEGYEGAIIRHGEGGYLSDKRPPTVLKLKAWIDHEFIVEKIDESPKDKVAMLHMRTKEGLWFKATAPGTFLEKRETLRDKDEYIGFAVTIRYAEETIDGKPSQPVAVAWRDK